MLTLDKVYRAHHLLKSVARYTDMIEGNGLTEDCDFPSETTDVENVVVPNTTKKVIENGQIYIIRDGVRYNALGAVVK